MTDLPKLIEEMRAGLEGVTPGPWKGPLKAVKTQDGAFDFAIGAQFGGRYECLVECFGRVSEIDYPNAEANARHLSRCSPENINALLDSHDQLVEALQACLGAMYGVSSVSADRAKEKALALLKAAGALQEGVE